MRIEFNPSMPMPAVAPLKMAPTTPVEPPLVSQSLTQPVTPEQVALFHNVLGQRVQGDFSRLSVQRRNRSRRFATVAEEHRWATFLFEQQEKHPHEDDGGESDVGFFTDDLSQGNINDCFLIAVLYAVLKNPKVGKQGLAKMISPLELFVPQKQSDGDVRFEAKTYYEVVFPGYRQYPVIVDPSEFLASEQVKAGIGFRILEYAFAKLSQKLSLSGSRGSSRLNDVLRSVHGGGYASITLYALTGKSVVVARPEQMPDLVAFKQFLASLSLTIGSQPENYIFVAGTDGEEDGYRDSEKRFANWHVYAMEYCRRSGRLFAVDPCDTKRKRYPVSVDDLFRYFATFVMAKI